MTTPTWDYASPIDESPDLPQEWIWERLRLRRDALLAATDWRVVSDANWPTQPWVTYRQALRDLPKNTKDPRIAAWPTPPSGSNNG